jgi:hypothetical protein
VITREDEESRLLERLRNLGITPSDDGCMGLTAREAEVLSMMIRQSTRHGESMQKHCEYRMHKVHRDYKNVEQRRDEWLLLRVIQVCRRR